MKIVNTYIVCVGGSFYYKMHEVIDANGKIGWFIEYPHGLELITKDEAIRLKQNTF